VERQLAHEEADKVRGAYNAAEYLTEAAPTTRVLNSILVLRPNAAIERSVNGAFRHWPLLLLERPTTTTGGVPKNDPLGVMQHIGRKVSGSQIDALALHLASLNPPPRSLPP
jgi:hypothetical protein